LTADGERVEIAAMTTRTHQTPATGTVEKLEDMHEVILFNDDHNDAIYVVDCLVRVFDHSPQLAAKIMLEAHTSGRAIAEVEGLTEARIHRDQLVSAGLSSEIHKLGC